MSSESTKISQIDIARLPQHRQEEARDLLKNLISHVKSNPNTNVTEAIQKISSLRGEPYTDTVLNWVTQQYQEGFREKTERRKRSNRIRDRLGKLVRRLRKNNIDQSIGKSREKELKAVKGEVADLVKIYMDNIDFFKSPNPDKAMEIAKAYGFNPVEVPLNSEIIDKYGQRSILSKDNSVKAGFTTKGNKVLYIGILNDSIFDPDDLYHDVGAIMLENSVGYFDPGIFLDLLNFSSGENLDLSDLQKMGLIDPDSDKIAKTYVLDSLVSGKLPFRLIKNI